MSPSRRRLQKWTIAFRSVTLCFFVTLAFHGADVEAQGMGAFPHGTFPEGVSCMDCHTTEGWKPIQEEPAFDHERTTGFPLLGRHAAASCRSCHQDLHFEKASASPGAAEPAIPTSTGAPFPPTAVSAIRPLLSGISQVSGSTKGPGFSCRGPIFRLAARLVTPMTKEVASVRFRPTVSPATRRITEPPK